jgi:hypothetical protein
MNSRADGPRFEEDHMEIDTKLLEKLAELKKQLEDVSGQKIDAAPGHSRRFHDVRDMSGLPESGHGLGDL